MSGDLPGTLQLSNIVELHPKKYKKFGEVDHKIGYP